MTLNEAFCQAAVVVPAGDGVLADLGYNVRELGLKGLGVVLENRKSKSLVAFPELGLKIWIDHTDMADVYQRAASGESEYQSLIPSFEPDRAMTIPLVFWVHVLKKHFNAKYFLGLEKGAWTDVWDDPVLHNREIFHGLPPDKIEKVSLGVEEFFEDTWVRAKEMLGERLLCARVLPAGLYKIELSFYLKSI